MIIGRALAGAEANLERTYSTILEVESCALGFQ
jgi:hypothetical protein